MSVYINTLGCARNLVDSEVMAATIRNSGYSITLDPAGAEVIIVNTCSFIDPAVNESIDTILELAAYKKTDSCQRLIVAGCLPERFGRPIVEAIPEVDVFLGTGAYDRVLEAVAGAFEPGTCILAQPMALPLPTQASGRQPTTYPMAYLKIGEGCNRHCTYCIIPKLRGRLRSRPAADIRAEACRLTAEGFKEIVLIAQDTSAYGQDLDGGERLAGLLDHLARESSDTWIRFLYGSPDHTDDALIQTVAGHPRLLPYFDLPIQHASESVLKRMGRQYRESDLLRLVANIRRAIPEATLRTTLLVGFPGETEADFDQLLRFIEKVRFDHAGVFIYCDAQDLASHKLANHVPEAIAQKRYERLMERQAEISLENNQSRIGKIYPVLVEDSIDKHLYIGRTAFQAPEVDGVTYIEAHNLTIGEFVDARIGQAYAYDLKGEVACPV